MKYETESCVLCEASASLLSKKIKNLPIKTIKEELNKLKNIPLKNLKFIFPKKFKEFKFLIKGIQLMTNWLMNSNLMELKEM